MTHAEALERITRIMPRIPSMGRCENRCSDCRREMREVLDIARIALGYGPSPVDDTEPGT